MRQPFNSLLRLLRQRNTWFALIPLTVLSSGACTTDSNSQTPDGSAGTTNTGGTTGEGGSATTTTTGMAGAGNATTGMGGAGNGGGTAGAGNAGGAGGTTGGTAGTGRGGAGGAGGATTGGAGGVDSGAPRGPRPLDLGSATNLAAPGSYVLLAKTGITNVTGSSIAGGHVGLSPAAATYITGFSLIADTTNVYATSIAVTAPGKVYASNYTPPTPSNLTTAVLGMEAAYSDAAGRANPDFLNLGSGNIGGLTLAPGLYSWGTAVSIPNDVTISGGANDVWIFQIANDLDVSSAKSVILGGGAQARNIFWQVAGQATIHANAHFEGILLSQTGITLQTTASMHGRALAQTLVAIDNSAVTSP